jgi:organic radical activating enzyme
MALELFDIQKRTRQTEYYDRSRDMEVALIWNALKKSLICVGREELFPYIKSVKVTEKSIIISTGKPLINQELSLLMKDIREVMLPFTGNKILLLK